MNRCATTAWNPGYESTTSSQPRAAGSRSSGAFTSASSVLNIRHPKSLEGAFHRSRAGHRRVALLFLFRRFAVNGLERHPARSEPDGLEPPAVQQVRVHGPDADEDPVVA